MARELAAGRMLFVGAEADRRTLTAYQAAEACSPTQEDAVAVASSLHALGRIPLL